MTKRRIILLLGVCFSIAFFAVRTQSETGSSNQTAKSTDNEKSQNITDKKKKEEVEKPLESLKNMTPEQAIKVLRHYRERERAEIRRRRELELEQMYEELAKEGRGPLISRKQRYENWQKKASKWSKELLKEKAALEVNDQQWKLIKPKLEKIRRLRQQSTSVVGLSLSGGSSHNEANFRSRARLKPPTWQWNRPWKGMASAELTDAQKLAKQLIALVENNNTTPEQFRRQMDALRKARKEEAKIKRQLSETQQELRELLTTRLSFKEGRISWQGIK